MTIIAILGAIIAASLIAGVAFIRAGIAREESATSLLGKPPTRASAVTRRVIGLYVRTPEDATQTDNRATDGQDYPTSAGTR
jgi:hypothetical protein